MCIKVQFNDIGPDVVALLPLSEFESTSDSMAFCRRGSRSSS
jgi:hypothetical protein